MGSRSIKDGQSCRTLVGLKNDDCYFAHNEIIKEHTRTLKRLTINMLLTLICNVERHD